MSDEVEEWKDVPGFPGYQVSDWGNVQSCRWPGVGGLRSGKWKPIKPWEGSLESKGAGIRYYVSLRCNGETVKKPVSVLVLETFVGLGNGLHCRHWDGNSVNNRLSNLCWGTQLENAEDDARLGVRKGIRSPMHKLDDDKVREIRRLRSEEHIGFWTLARMFGVDRNTIKPIIRGITWTHVK
jgi:hypothetical protein